MGVNWCRDWQIRFPSFKSLFFKHPRPPSPRPPPPHTHRDDGQLEQLARLAALVSLAVVCDGVCDGLAHVPLLRRTPVTQQLLDLTRKVLKIMPVEILMSFQNHESDRPVIFCSDITNDQLGISGETGHGGANLCIYCMYSAATCTAVVQIHSWCVTPHSSPTRGGAGLSQLIIF